MTVRGRLGARVPDSRVLFGAAGLVMPALVMPSLAMPALVGRRLAAASLAASLLLMGCAGRPPAPAWQANARTASDRATGAYLEGNARVDAAELDRARRELAATGRLDLLARVELVHCAAQVASLVFGPCAGFERLRADAAPAERAYADYLRGHATAADIRLLPEAHRGAPPSAIADPLARLIAAGVLLEVGLDASLGASLDAGLDAGLEPGPAAGLHARRADPAVVALAVETASAQGWRRPLLAWLGLQARLAEAAGAADELARVKRRIALVGGEPVPANH